MTKFIEKIQDKKIINCIFSENNQINQYLANRIYNII